MRFSVIFTSPSGDDLDVSARLEIGEMGTLTLEPESDLGVLTHGNLSLTLDNADGKVRAFFDGATPSSVYLVTVDRESADGSGWSRSFRGVIDVQYSLIYDRAKKTAAVTCYSFSKLLERTSAETIARPLIARIASINSGTKTLAFVAGASQASGLDTGDSVTIRNAAGGQESFTINHVVDPDTALTTVDSTQTFTSGAVTLDTPFYRDRTIKFLAGVIAANNGLTLDEASLDAEVAAFVIVTPLTNRNNTVVGKPLSLVPTGTTVLASWGAQVYLNRWSCDSPQGVWSIGALTNNWQSDWTPYLLSEPGTIYDRVGDGTSRSGTHDINRLWAESGAPCWSPWCYGPGYIAECVDYATGDRWQLYYSKTGGTPKFDTLVSRKNGAFLATIESIDIGGGGDWGDFHGWIDWDPINGVAHASYQYIPVSGDAPTIRKYGYLTNPGGVFTAIDSARSGQLRCSRVLGPSGSMILYDSSFVHSVGEAAGGTIRFYDLSGALAAGGGYRGNLQFHPGYPRLWTARVLDDRLYFLYQTGFSMYLAIYDASVFAASAPAAVATVPFIASYRVADKEEKENAFLTIMKLTDNRRVIIGFTGDEWFVASKRYDGVVRYADFSGKSCGAASAQLALISNLIVTADAFGVLSMRSRQALGSGDSIRDLGTPLDDSERFLSDVYRSSVRVTGKLPAGGDIDVTFGDTGDSARRLTINSELVTTSGMAAALAVAMFGFVSSVRSQRDVTVKDDDKPLSPFDVVTLDDKRFVVYKVSTDLEQRVQHLTLLELAP